MYKKILIIISIILLLIIIYKYNDLSKIQEMFTDQEMKNYYIDLKRNCCKSKKLLKKLKQHNKLICNSSNNNNDNRNNINNNMLCYNDTLGEIVNNNDLINDCIIKQK